jgi:pantoate--beta-alanine ligase
MQIIREVKAMQAACREARRAGKTIGLVPTMGALHAGHVSLVRAARQQSDFVTASIFVNPLQFGPTEDLDKYPRTFEADCRKLEAEGTDLLFAPANAEMYPANASTYVNVEGLSSRLDGASRPGHFRGVTTVVAKLFEIVRPDRAFFGQKDAAQVAVLRRMVRDLNMDLELVVCPIVREEDGLAMSSRNVYLSPAERKAALCLSQSLAKIRELYATGQHDRERLMSAARTIIAAEPLAKLDYYELLNWDTLEPLNEARPGALVAVAAWVGSTRLIDNCVLQ